MMGVPDLWLGMSIAHPPCEEIPPLTLLRDTVAKADAPRDSILIVDDDPQARRTLSAALEPEP